MRRLDVCVLHEQRIRLRIALEVDPADQLAADHHRHDVVAVLALQRGRVDRDAVVKVPEAQRPRPVPHQRVEGRQDRIDVTPAGPRLVACEVRGAIPALDRDLGDVAALEQHAERTLRIGEVAEAVVVAQIVERGDAEVHGCAAQQFVVRGVVVDGVADVVAVTHIEHPLEPLAAGHDEVAPAKERADCAVHGVLVPPAAGHAHIVLMLDLGDGQGAAIADLREQLAMQVAVALEVLGKPLAKRLLSKREQRQVVGADQRGLVRPRLGDRTE